MVTKKLFALASVTALTGLMSTVAASGCSSTKTEEAPGDSGTVTPTDGGKTDAKKPSAEATKPAADATKPATEAKK